MHCPIGIHCSRCVQVLESAEQLHAMLRNGGTAPSAAEEGRNQGHKHKGRLVAAASLVAASLMQPELLAVRLVKAASMLAMIHMSQ